MGAHELGKLGDDAGERAEAVVLGEGGEQVLDDAVFVGAANVLLQLLDDLLLVRYGEGGRTQNVGELGVAFEDAGELVERLGCWVECVGLRGCGVLESGKRGCVSLGACMLCCLLLIRITMAPSAPFFVHLSLEVLPSFLGTPHHGSR